MFQGIGFEVITLTTGIAAVLHVKAVTVQGAYHLTGSINKTIGHDAAGMGAFLGKSIILLLITRQGNGFARHLYHTHIIRLPGKGFRQVAQQVPLGRFCKHGLAIRNAPFYTDT